MPPQRRVEGILKNSAGEDRLDHARRQLGSAEADDRHGHPCALLLHGSVIRMAGLGHELPVEAYLWQVFSAPKNARRSGCVHAINVRQRWRAYDSN
jgi:hypothetical protein